METHTDDVRQLEQWAEKEEALIARMREEAAEIVAEEERLIDRWVREQYGEPAREDRDLRDEELKQREGMQREVEDVQGTTP